MNTSEIILGVLYIDITNQVINVLSFERAPFPHHLILFVLRDWVRVLLLELQERLDLLHAIVREIHRLENCWFNSCRVDRWSCRPGLLHNRRLCRAHRVLQVVILLLRTLQDVEFLGVSAFAIVQPVLVLRPDLHHCAEFP